MKVTVVMDNMAATGAAMPFVAEHGLSLLIEIHGRKVLMDTGQTGNVVGNLSLLNIHPRQIDAIVLSHGHYDHTGGLAEFLRHRGAAISVYAHPSIFQERYSRKGEERRFAGLPFPKAYLTGLGAEWRLHEEPFEILPGLWFSGSIPRQAEFEQGDPRLILLDEHEHCCQDSISDDSVLFYKEGDSLTVISGCAHSGFVNIVTYGRRLTGAVKLKGWIGGTHLGPVSQEQKSKSLDFIRSLDIDFLAANHCTGFEVMCMLRQMLGEKFIPAFVGTVIES